MLLFSIVDFKTALSSNYMAVISGVESEYDAFWTLRIDKLGDIYGQKTIFYETLGSLQEDNITYFANLLKSDEYKDKQVQIFASIRNGVLLQKLITEVGNLGKEILFFKGGFNEKKIIEIATLSTIESKLDGHSILHIYDDEDVDGNTEYNNIITSLTSANTIDDRESRDNDVFMIGLANIIVDVFHRVDTYNVLDILPFIYNIEYPFPGGKLVLLENNNIATSWYIYRFVYDSTATPTIKAKKNSTIAMNKGFTHDQYFDRYYSERCNLLNPEKNMTELDVIKTLMVTEYNLNLNDKYLRRMLHEMVSYYNENVFAIIILIYLLL